MSTRQIPTEALAGLSDQLPRTHTIDVTMEVIGDEIGDQVEADHLPWHSLVYDSDNDVVEVSVGGHAEDHPVTLRHAIHNPTKVWVEEREGTIRSLSIEAATGPKTIIRFHPRATIEGESGTNPGSG